MERETYNIKRQVQKAIKRKSNLFHVSRFTFHEKGFTLIEILVYAAITAIVTSVIVLFLVSSLNAYNKSQALQNTLNNTNDSLKFIIDEIRYAGSVYTLTSVFNSDNGQLSLETLQNAPSGENSGFTDFYLDNGRIYRKREGYAAMPITSERVFITKLRFSQFGTTGVNDSIAVEVNGTINDPGGKQSSQASINLKSTAALRGAY